MPTAPLAMDTNGTILFLLLPAVANMATPTITECTAGTVKDLSCYLTADGLSLSTSENSVEDTRLCTKQVFETPGDFTESMELTYVYNSTSPSDDVARLALTAGVVKFAVVRYGIDPDDTISTGDIVDVYKFRAGKQRKNTPGRNSVHTITQKMFLSAVTRPDVAVIA
jgi:hypothetical protein